MCSAPPTALLIMAIVVIRPEHRKETEDTAAICR
jgi:hypothetical protein